MEIASAILLTLQKNTAVAWQFYRKVVALLKACAVKCRYNHVLYFTVGLGTHGKVCATKLFLNMYHQLNIGNAPSDVRFNNCLLESKRKVSKSTVFSTELEHGLSSSRVH